MLPTEQEPFGDYVRAIVGTLRVTSISEESMKVWFTALRRYPLIDIKRAMMQWVNTNDKAPTPAQIKQILQDSSVEAERTDRPAPRLQCCWIDRGEPAEWSTSEGRKMQGFRMQRCEHFSDVDLHGSACCRQHVTLYQQGARAHAGAFA